MDTINCIGAYGNMLMIFKELSKRIRTKIGNARKTDGIITLEDIGTVLKDFEDFMNNNLAQYNKEVKIDFTDNVPQQDPNDVPFEITNLQNNNESKNMNKKLIRLTESDLHRIVKESVNRILKEYSDDYGIESDYDFYGTYGNPSQYIRNSEADFDGQAGRSRDLFPYKRGLASLSAQSEKPKEWRGDDLQFVDEPDDEAWSSKINGRAGISPKIARMEKGWDKAFNPNKADIVYHGNDEDNINHATWDN